ncbi:MAG: aminodeoxychorismate synthase component I [Wenzhouxiangellaceae bacterium]|nr:aminodeoxychorismate synthase component I [Wenzhouxiangellaceae bacterium]
MSLRRSLSARPDLLAMHRRAPARWPFFLDSASRGGSLGRWSILMRTNPASPALQIGHEGIGSFLPMLESDWNRFKAPQAGQLPFEGGWFIYLGYEFAAEIEPKLNLPPSGDDLPVAFAQRCDGAVLVDHERLEAWAVAESDSLLHVIVAEAAEYGLPMAASTAYLEPRLAAEDGAGFIDGVRRIRQYIADGDVFQTNLSRAWHGTADSPIDAATVYQSLADRNAAPFAGLARLPGGTLVSSSPERLISSRDGWVEARPIAGTRPRGASPEQDRALSSELLDHPKERAEHIMLIDLERNDLGRVCRPGSVEVDELMVLESYAHVHHIVSNVRGRLRAEVTPADVIRAAFPGGTITGCPKVRCMQIIAELESSGRSFYTGSMGYLGLNGSMDLNILIRSMLVSGNQLWFRTGAGIVADSEPHAELAETEDKARGLLRALSRA